MEYLLIIPSAPRSLIRSLMKINSGYSRLGWSMDEPIWLFSTRPQSRGPAWQIESSTMRSPPVDTSQDARKSEKCFGNNHARSAPVIVDKIFDDFNFLARDQTGHAWIIHGRVSQTGPISSSRQQISAAPFRFQRGQSLQAVRSFSKQPHKVSSLEYALALRVIHVPLAVLFNWRDRGLFNCRNVRRNRGSMSEKRRTGAMHRVSGLNSGRNKTDLVIPAQNRPISEGSSWNILPGISVCSRAQLMS